jgi:intein-encoded DNA endonuclease-like protein
MGVVGLDIISKRGERRKILPLEIRMKMYEDVIELGRQGLTQREIQKRIHEKHGIRLPQPTISVWTNGKHNPFGNINKFDEKPSPKLAYIIGAILSDGYKYITKKKFNYSIRIAVNDREFAEKFAECLTEILKKKKPYKPFYDKNQKKWVVAGYSIRLYKFLNRKLKELKRYIEYDKDCVSAFLQAVFDGDGSIHKRTLLLYNTDKKLLSYVQYLLKKYFDIDTTGPHLARKKSNIIHSPKANKDEYYIYIRAKSLQKFYECIGFVIKRKQQRLIKAVK